MINNNITFKLYISTITLLLFFLSSCATKVTPEQKEIRAIKSYINSSCVLNKYADIKHKDVNLATIYFQTNKYKLTNNDKKVLDKVISVYNQCNNKIMVIGNASQKEKKQNFQSYKISYERAHSVYKYLANQVNKSQIYMMFCDTSRRRYIENNKTAVLGNQRVDIVLLSSSFLNNFLSCLGNNNE